MFAGRVLPQLATHIHTASHDPEVAYNAIARGCIILEGVDS